MHKMSFLDHTYKCLANLFQLAGSYCTILARRLLHQRHYIPTIPPDYQLMHCPIAYMYPCHHHQLTRHSCIRVQTHQTHHQDTRFICTRHLPAPWWYHPPGAVCGSPASTNDALNKKFTQAEGPLSTVRGVLTVVMDNP